MKKWNLRMLRKHDAEKDDCAVRELEMVVDDALTSPGYRPQFWTDVELYGVDEAILYVRNGNHGDADAIRSAWITIRNRL